MTQFLDLATFMKHVAVETFVAENDGLLGYAGMNNFYLYQFQDRPQFQVITWDKDNAFAQADFPLFLRADRNVLMRRALTIPAARQAYLDGVIAAADSAAEGQVGVDGGTGWLAREIERLYALIRSASQQDQSKPYSDADFEAAVAGLRVFARVRGGFVRCEVANLSRVPQACAAAGSPAAAAGALRIRTDLQLEPFSVLGSRLSVTSLRLVFTENRQLTTENRSRSVALCDAEVEPPAADRNEVPLEPVDAQGQLQDPEGADPHFAVGLRAEVLETARLPPCRRRSCEARAPGRGGHPRPAGRTVRRGGRVLPAPRRRRRRRGSAKSCALRACSRSGPTRRADGASTPTCSVRGWSADRRAASGPARRTRRRPHCCSRR